MATINYSTHKDMKEFNVYVDITYSVSFNVEAETPEEAKRKAEEIAEKDPQYHIRFGSFCGAGAYDCEERHSIEDIF